jgi:uncharacterized RDD family membrane protein YckC
MGFPDEVASSFLLQYEFFYPDISQRILAFLIDLIILGTTAGLLLYARMSLPQDPFQFGFIIGGLISLLKISLVMITLGALIYFPVAEGRFGQTIGKRVMNLWVLKENGLPIGYKEAIIRRLSFYFEIWLIDILFILFTEKKQRGFDIVAKTVVVQFQEGFSIIKAH